MSGAGQVTFRLNVDSSNAKQGAASARDALRDTATAADKTTSSLRDLEKQSDRTADAGARIGNSIGAGIGLITKAVTAGSAALLGLSYAAIRGMDGVYLSSQRLGASTEFLSSLKVAAQQNDINFGRLNTTLNEFSSNVTKAAGGSRVQAQLFDQMGVSVKNADGSVRSLADILPDVADKFAAYKDGPTKAALANKLFGESGSDLLGLLNDLGDKGFARVREEAEKLGLVVDEKTAKAAHALNDEFTQLIQTGQGYFNAVARDVLPSLVDLAQRFNGAALDAADLNDKTTIVGTALREVIHDIDDLIGVLGHLPDDVNATKAAFGGWADELERVINLLPKVKQSSGDGLFQFPGADDTGFFGSQAVNRFLRSLNAPTAGSSLDQKMTQDLTDPFKDLHNVLSIVVPDIDKTSASLDGLAVHVDATTKATRQLNAPFADLTRNRKGDNGLALENQLESFERYADSLSEKVGGPLQQAFQKYSDTLDAIDAKAEKLVIDGANVNRVIAAQNQAYDNATAALNRNLTAIKLRNEQNDAWVVSQNKIQDVLGDMAKAQEDDLALVEAQIAAGGELSIVQKAQFDIQQLLTHANEAERKVIEENTKAYLDNAKARQSAHAQEKLIDDFSQVLNSATQSLSQGEDVWKALGDAALPVLGEINKQIEAIIQANTDVTSGVTDWASAVDDLGASVQAVLPKVAQFAGTAAGGGGQGAATGAALGYAIGSTVFASYGGAYWGPIVGGLIGGLFDHDRKYEARVSGGPAHDEQTVTGPFGPINVGQSGDNQDPNLAGKIRDFDKLIAGILPPELVDDVTERIQAFNGSFASLDELLAARFNAVLDALDPVISDFVRGFSSDLQTEIQALSDIFQLQKLDNAGRLVTNNLSDALDLIGKFGRASERIADTYSRLVTSTVDYQQALQLMGATFDGSKTQLVEFAQNISDAIGTTQEADALWQQFFQGFYSQAEITAANINLLQSRASDSLTKIGLDATISMQDFRAKFEAALPTLTPEEVAQWLQAGVALGSLNDAINALIEQGENLVDKLYGGGTLSDVNSQIAALEGQADHASSSVQHFGSAMTSAADAARHAADLLLGALSPLNDEQKLQYALTGLRRGTVTQEQVLEIGRQLYASSQAYTDLFNMVRAIGDRTGTLNSGGNFNAATSQQSNTLSAADQQRLDELYARRDELQARERRQDANQLATVVAQLGFTQKKSFDDVADFLGFHLSDLAKDLGLTNDQLNDFLTNIQTQQNAIPDAVTAGSDNVVRALYDIAGKDLPPWAVGSHDEVTGPARGHSGHARGTIQVPGSIVGGDVTRGSTAADAQASANTLLRQIADNSSETVRVLRDVHSSTRDVAAATRTVNATLRTPASPGRRNARVAT
jgi:hypothetical protein